MNKITEFKVMYNCYDGRGNVEYSVHTDALESVKDKAYIDAFIVIDKGVSWIECREVSEWKRATIK